MSLSSYISSHQPPLEYMGCSKGGTVVDDCIWRLDWQSGERTLGWGRQHSSVYVILSSNSVITGKHCLWSSLLPFVCGGLATNVEYRTILLLFGLGLSTACTVTNQIASLIREKMLHLHIKTPTEAEFRDIVTDSWTVNQDQVSAVEQSMTHIPIIAPPQDKWDLFNR